MKEETRQEEEIREKTRSEKKQDKRRVKMKREREMNWLPVAWKVVEQKDLCALFFQQYH